MVKFDQLPERRFYGIDEFEDGTTARGNADIAERVWGYERSAPWNQYVMKHHKFGGGRIMCNVDATLEDAMFLPRVISRTLCITDESTSRVRHYGNDVFHAAVSACIEDATVLEKIREGFLKITKAHFLDRWGLGLYVERSKEQFLRSMGSDSQSGFHIAVIPTYEMVFNGFCGFSDGDELIDTQNRYALAWSVNANGLLYKLMLAAYDELKETYRNGYDAIHEKRNEIQTFGFEALKDIATYATLNTMPYRDDWKTCDVGEMINDMDACVRAISRVMGSAKTFIEKTDMFGTTVVPGYSKRDRIVQGISYDSTITSYLYNVFPWIEREVESRKSVKNEESFSFVVPTNRMSDDIVKATSLISSLERHEILEQFKGKGFPDQAAAVLVDGNSNTRIPMFVVNNSLGFDALLVPVSPKVIDTMQKMYGMPKRDVLMHLSVRDEMLTTTNTDSFPKLFAKRYDVSFVGKVNILDFIQEKSETRTVDADSAMENVFYMFVKKTGVRV